MERRPFAGDVALLYIDGRLVDREPVPHAGEMSCNLGDVACKKSRAVTPEPPAASREPGRVREVMERNQRLDVSLAQRRNDVDIVIQRFAVPYAFLGLDSAPFDRKPMGVVTPGSREIEVLAVALVVIAGNPRLERQLTALLVLPPVIPTVVALDLMSRRRGTPKKRFRELEESAHALMRARPRKASGPH